MRHRGRQSTRCTEVVPEIRPYRITSPADAAVSPRFRSARAIPIGSAKPEFTDVALSSLVSRARDQRKISDAPEPQAPCVLPVPLVRIRCARSGWVVKKV